MNFYNFTKSVKFRQFTKLIWIQPLHPFPVKSSISHLSQQLHQFHQIATNSASPPTLIDFNQAINLQYFHLLHHFVLTSQISPNTTIATMASNIFEFSNSSFRIHFINFTKTHEWQQFQPMSLLSIISPIRSTFISFTMSQQFQQIHRIVLQHKNPSNISNPCHFINSQKFDQGQDFRNNFMNCTHPCHQLVESHEFVSSQ